MEPSTTNTKTTQNNGTPTLPSPDFSTLQSAAATYRMFGATPIPLFNDAKSGSSGLAGGADSLEPYFFRGPEWIQDSGGSQTEDEVNWQKADGIGVITGRGGWHGLLVEPLELRSVIHDLRMQDTAWVARNDDSALIYFRTDASRAILRALASIFRASKRPLFTIASDVDAFGGPGGPAVLPAPPSQDLAGGHWEFPKDEPQAPPPYRAFEVGAEIRPEGSPEKPGEKNRRGMSKSTPSLGKKRNYERQSQQGRRQSKWSLPHRNTP